MKTKTKRTRKTARVGKKAKGRALRKCSACGSTKHDLRTCGQ